MNYSDLYKEIAIYFCNIFENKQESDKYIREAIYTIIDLKIDDINNAKDIIFFFTKVLNDLFRDLLYYQFSENFLIRAVTCINKYTTNTIKVTNMAFFVNNIWEDGVPNSWRYLCEKSGEDISEWNISS
jgi:hypothetical protein